MDNVFLKKYKDTQLRNLQLKELSILTEIDKLCRKHNIDYWLDGGTILGAVRHNGFIPWDDDIDIAIMQDDVTRFIEIMQKELPPHLFVQTKENDSTQRVPILKIRDRNSLLFEGGDDLSLPYEKGIYVDIFPFIPYPNRSKAFYKRVCRGICRSGAILKTKKQITLRNIAEWLYFSIKYRYLRTEWFFANLFSGKKKHLGNVLHNNGYGIGHLNEWIFPTKDIIFEDKTFRGPANEDAYLKNLYGDYMRIPDEDKRQTHAVFFIPELIKEEE